MPNNLLNMVDGVVGDGISAYLGDHNICGYEYLAQADGSDGNEPIDVQWCFLDDCTCLGATYNNVYFYGTSRGSRTKKKPFEINLLIII